MDNLHIIRDKIAKAEIDEAFFLIKEFLMARKLKRSSKILNDVILLEYQYNEIKKNDALFSREDSSVSKNRVINSLLAEVTHLELKTKKYTSAASKRIKKLQMATEMAKAKTYSELSDVVKTGSKGSGDIKNDNEGYLRQRIVKLEKINKWLLFSNRIFGASISFIIITILIKHFIDWDYKFDNHVSDASFYFREHLGDDSDDNGIEDIFFGDSDDTNSDDDEDGNDAGSGSSDD